MASSNRRDACVRFRFHVMEVFRKVPFEQIGQRHFYTDHKLESLAWNLGNLNVKGNASGSLQLPRLTAYHCVQNAESHPRQGHPREFRLL